MHPLDELAHERHALGLTLDLCECEDCEERRFDAVYDEAYEAGLITCPPPTA